MVARRRTSRAAIVSTMRSPGRAMLEAWLDYHRAIGFARFFLYFDDPRDPDRQIVAKARDVIAVPRDKVLMKRLRTYSLWKEWGRFAVAGRGGDRTMARQMLHVQDALAHIARTGSPIDWLVHLDHDELFVAPGDDANAHFAKLGALGVDHSIYLNYEAVPETIEINDVFREVTLFKRNPTMAAHRGGNAAALSAARLFMAYWNGKAATRVASGGVPDGVHRFAAGAHPLVTRAFESPYVLHYPNCGFSRWRAKYAQLGTFGNHWFGTQPNLLRFHLDSRDLRSKPTVLARRYFRRRAMLSGPARRALLTERGLLVRIRRAARVLEKVRSRHRLP